MGWASCPKLELDAGGSGRGGTGSSAQCSWKRKNKVSQYPTSPLVLSLKTDGDGMGKHGTTKHGLKAVGGEKKWHFYVRGIHCQLIKLLPLLQQTALDGGLVVMVFVSLCMCDEERFGYRMLLQLFLGNLRRGRSWADKKMML